MNSPPRSRSAPRNSWLLRPPYLDFFFSRGSLANGGFSSCSLCLGALGVLGGNSFSFLLFDSRQSVGEPCGFGLRPSGRRAITLPFLRFAIAADVVQRAVGQY